MGWSLKALRAVVFLFCFTCVAPIVSITSLGRLMAVALGGDPSESQVAPDAGGGCAGPSSDTSTNSASGCGSADALASRDPLPTGDIASGADIPAPDLGSSIADTTLPS